MSAVSLPLPVQRLTYRGQCTCWGRSRTPASSDTLCEKHCGDSLRHRLSAFQNNYINFFFFGFPLWSLGNRNSSRATSWLRRLTDWSRPSVHFLSALTRYWTLHPPLPSLQCCLKSLTHQLGTIWYCILALEPLCILYVSSDVSVCVCQRQRKIQKDRLVNDFSAALNNFQKTQRQAADKEREFVARVRASSRVSVSNLPSLQGHVTSEWPVIYIIPLSNHQSTSVCFGLVLKAAPVWSLHIIQVQRLYIRLKLNRRCRIKTNATEWSR